MNALERAQLMLKVGPEEVNDQYKAGWDAALIQFLEETFNLEVRFIPAHYEFHKK